MARLLRPVTKIISRIPGRVGFFHGILNQRLVHHRQHFLRAGLGRRQETRAETGDREDCLLNFFWTFIRITIQCDSG
jgi:hypothetical protein